jgi:hypothetical protein
VFTNDPQNPSLGLTISGKVEKFVTVSPNVVRLFGLAGTPIKATVQIIPEKKYPFRITEVKAKDGSNINFKLQEEKKSQIVRYALTVENKKTEKGRYHDIVYLKTDNRLKPQIKVNVYGNINEIKPKGNT